MNLIPAKQIVSKSKKSAYWFDTEYNMNIYKGCSHGCIYCDSRSDCYHIENFDSVRAKENALQIIEQDLLSKRKKGVISSGAMSDPYNPFEQREELTRGALELIHRHRFGIHIMTKSDLVARDIDLFEKINKHSPVLVCMTITTIDDELCKKIEPRVSATFDRFAAIQKLTEHGLNTGVLMMPILPFVNDTIENVVGIVEAAAKAGAKFVYPAFGVTLRQNQRDYYYNQLDKHFPGLKQKYMNTYRYEYNCSSLNQKGLHIAFKNACEKEKLLYKINEINCLLKPKNEEEQLTLF
ncbi:MAG: radical protein [Bacillales bacterium]|jgi:DNA repair photolyase|nr:radical protein [Bacillales bacterium]